MTDLERFAEACERAANECLDARTWDEWTGSPRGGNAILERDAATLQNHARAIRAGRVSVKEDGKQ